MRSEIEATIRLNLALNGGWQSSHLFFREIERWLFGLPDVSNQTGDEIDEEVGRAAVAGVLNLGDILELVNDGLNDETFTRQQLVFENDESVFMFLRIGVIGNGRSAAIRCSPRAKGCSKNAVERSPRSPTSFPHSSLIICGTGLRSSVLAGVR